MEINWGNVVSDAPAPEVPQGGIDRPRPPSVADVLGGTAQLVLQALQLPRRGVQTLLGGAGGEAGFRQNPIGMMLGNALPAGVGQALLGPLGPAATQQVMQRLPEEAQQGVREYSQDVLTDPLNLVGMGLPGKAAAGLPAGSKLLPILRALDTGETLTQKMLNAVLLAPARLGKAALEHVPAPGVKVLEQQPVQRAGQVVAQAPVERAATSLYDALAATSGKSLFKQDVRALGDTISGLLDQGVNLRRAISDEDLAGAGKLFYTLPKGGAFSGKPVLEKLEADLMTRLGEAPNAAGQAAWVELTRALETANAEAWHSAYAQRAASGYSSGSTGQKVNNQFYKDAVEAVTNNYKAAFDVLDDAYTAAKRLQLDPAAEQQIGQIVADAVPHLQSAMDTPSVGLYPIVAKGRRSVQDLMPERLAELTQRAQSVDQVADAVRSATEPLLDPTAAALTHPGTLAGRMGERLSQLDFLRRQLPGELANVPEFSQGLLTDTRHQMIRLATRAERGRQGFENGIKEIWDAYLPGQKFPEFDLSASSTPDEILGHINQVLGRISNAPSFPGVLPPVTNSVELLDVIRSYAKPDTFNKVDQLVREFPGADLLTGSPFLAAWDRASRGLAKRYGIDNEKTVAGTMKDVLSTGNALFKEQALATFTYPLVNASGALFNSVIAGAPPVRLAGNLVKAMGEAARGQYVVPDYIQNFETKMGMPFGGAAKGESSAILDLEAQAVREYTKTGQPVYQKIGQPLMGAGGAVLGGASGLAGSPEDATPDERMKNALIGAGIGGAWFGGPGKGLLRAADRPGALGRAADTAMELGGALVGGHPGMAELVRRMSIAIEDVARKEVALMGAVTKNQELLPAYQKVVQDAVAGSKTPYVPTRFDPNYIGKLNPGQVGPPRIGQTVPELTRNIIPRSGAADRITTALEQLNWQAPPDVVRNLLIHEDVHPGVAQKAAEAWRTLNGTAMKAGEETAAQVHFDYQHLSNFEQFMREFTPFSTWAIKSLPFFAQHLTQKPLLLVSVLQAEQAMERERKEGGLPGRFAGSAHAGFGDWFWSKLLGHDVLGFYNPIRGLLPFSDTLRNVQEKPDAGPFEQFTSALQALGLPQPSPFLMTGARVAGLMGDAPAQSMVRVGPAIQGVTAALGVNRGRGIDLGAAQESAERNLRRAGAGSVTGPQDVANPAELSTMHRIDELYMRQYGKPISASPGQEALPFMLAKVERSGPIWDAAAAEVAKDRGLRSAVGFIYNPAAPQAVLTPEEEAIRYSRTQNILSPKLARDVNDAAGTHPTELADPSVLAAVEQASLTLVARTSGGTEQPPKIQKLLENPTNANVQQVVKEMQEAQATLNPLASGYSVSGSTDEARLKAALGLYMNQGLGVAGGAGQTLSDLARTMRGEGALSGAATGRPQLSSKGLNPISQILAQVQQAQDAQKASNPVLGEYLAWKRLHPTGDVEDFFKAKRAGQVAALPATP